jgi:endonuclease YncB( thermonuclease family)
MKAFVLLILLAVAFVFTCPAQTIIKGKVVAVHDGDTVTVLDAARKPWKIRLMGIDAPELGQAFGNDTKGVLSAYVYGKKVIVHSRKTDRYGRVVGQVILEQPIKDLYLAFDAGLRQVSMGLAWHYKAFEPEQSPEDRRVYAEVERSARRERIGLWSQASPTPPWKFRRGTTDKSLPEGAVVANRNSRIYHTPGC